MVSGLEKIVSGMEKLGREIYRETSAIGKKVKSEIAELLKDSYLGMIRVTKKPEVYKPIIAASLVTATYCYFTPASLIASIAIGSLLGLFLLGICGYINYCSIKK